MTIQQDRGGNGGNGGNGKNTGADRALRQQRVAAAIEDAHRRHAGADAMIYFGARHGAYPTILLRDPFLKPAQMVLYLILHQQFQNSPAHGASQSERIPEAKYVTRQLKITSRTTLAFCFKMLRATRWLSLIDPRIRDRGGRIRGNLYALHSEPCSLDDALYLDPGYMELVESLAVDGNRRTRKTGYAILATIDAEFAQREFDQAAEVFDPAERPRPTPGLERQEQRLEAMQAADAYEQGLPVVATDLFFSGGVDPLELSEEPTIPASLAENPAESTEKPSSGTMSKKWTWFENTKSEPCPKNGHGLEAGNSPRNHVQKMDMVQNLDTEGSGSCFSYKKNLSNKTTTTTPPISPPSPNSPAMDRQAIETGEQGFDWDALEYPERLNPNELVLARRLLARAKPEHRQLVLDELSGRLKTKEQTGGRIHDPLAYLGRLVTIANQGALEPSSSALRIENERRRQDDLAKYQAEAGEKLRRRAEALKREEGE